MRRTFGWLALAGALAVLPPATADDEKKDDEKKAPPKTSVLAPPPAKDEAKNKYVVVRTVTGRPMKGDEGATGLVLEVVGGIGRYARPEKHELTLAEDVKYYTKFVPEIVDDKGNTRRMTPAELAKVRDRKLNAYPTDAKALANATQVEVTLSTLKEAGPKKSAKDKAAEKPAVFVTQVIILAEDRPPAGKPPAKK